MSVRERYWSLYLAHMEWENVEAKTTFREPLFDEDARANVEAGIAIMKSVADHPDGTRTELIAAGHKEDPETAAAAPVSGQTLIQWL